MYLHTPIYLEGSSQMIAVFIFDIFVWNQQSAYVIEFPSNLFHVLSYENIPNHGND